VIKKPRTRVGYSTARGLQNTNPVEKKYVINFKNTTLRIYKWKIKLDKKRYLELMESLNKGKSNQFELVAIREPGS